MRCREPDSLIVPEKAGNTAGTKDANSWGNCYVTVSVIITFQTSHP